MNKVILMGRLTRDPEVHYAQSKESMAIARYTLAVYKRRAKESSQNAEFIDIVAFNKNAEFAEKYLKKGMMIALSGSLHKSIWEDAGHAKHTRIEVIVDEQYFTSSKKQTLEETHAISAASEIASSKLDKIIFDDEDIPY